MKALVEFLVRGIVSQPELVVVNAVEGESSVLLELSVSPADVDAVLGREGETFQALRTLLSASSGRRKAVLELAQVTEAVPAGATDGEGDDVLPDDPTEG